MGGPQCCLVGLERWVWVTDRRVYRLKCKGEGEFAWVWLGCYNRGCTRLRSVGVYANGAFTILAHQWSPTQDTAKA